VTNKRSVKSFYSSKGFYLLLSILDDHPKGVRGNAMQKDDDARRCLAEDVASLTRVRNRFSKSSDQRLHTIVPALIPKLFERLENYRILITTNDENNDNEDNEGNSDDNDNNKNKNNELPSLDASTLSCIQKAQHDIYGILANAMERLRGNPNISTDSLVRPMIPFVSSNNPVVGTWALAFLQVSIQRTLVTNFSLLSVLIPSLLESVGRLHKRIAQYTGENSVSDDPLEARWIRASWLLLDCIVLYSGEKPMVDWSVDTFDTTQITQRTRPADNHDISNNDDKSCPRSSILKEAARVMDADINGQSTSEGFFSLMLDLVLFWPGHSRQQLSSTGNNLILSQLGKRRLEHRNELVLASINDNEEENTFTPLQQQFRRVPRRPRRRTTEWSDSSKTYLRYMKSVCLELAIGPPSRGLFQGRNNDRALLLSILVADYESMHGRIAVSYLNRWNVESKSVPLPVAASILVLIIGEDKATELPDASGKKYGTGLVEGLLCSKSKSGNILRPPLTWATSSRAANFLVENSLELSDSTGTINANIDTNDGKYVILLIELSLKLLEVDDNGHKFLAMRLVFFFYNHLQRPEAAFASKVFDAATKILTILVDFSVDDELRTLPRRNDQIPLGVPAPFGGRNDLNQLLQSHRQSLKRKNLKRDDAIEAREIAYKFIASLSSYIFERSDASPFHFPNLLLQCAVYEDRHLEHYLTNALDSILIKYEEKLDKDQSLFKTTDKNFGGSLQQQATSILPALLETVCSGAVYVRVNAIQWIQKLLLKMDAEAASYLASHLVRDENLTVAGGARKIIDTAARNAQPAVVSEALSVSFIDITKNDGLIKIQNKLEQRSKDLAGRLQISSCEQSVVLLLYHKFSELKAEVEYHNNQATCLDLCGLVSDDNISMEENADDIFQCGICYDEMEPEQTYFLRCGHKFCKSCWISYTTDASNDSSLMNFLDLRCPQHECGVRVMMDDLQRLEPSLIPKWNNALLQTFIEEDSSHRYCSGPDCGCVAIKSNQSIATTYIRQKVTCDTCSTSFCFGCGQNDHAPASCQDIAQWNLIKGSSEFYVKHNSKP